MNKVAAEQGFNQVRLVVKKLWRMLPTIHSEFGFFGHALSLGQTELALLGGQVVLVEVIRPVPEAGKRVWE